MVIKLPPYVITAIEILEKAGHEAYIVGGCVRDALLGLTPSDYDITTSAFPEETEAAFDGYKVIETGLRHGTVTVLIDGETLEITTFRTDGNYLDNRHPENVSFTLCLEEDLARRDFTVNAMAYNPKRGLIDIFGGGNDIENKILRAVGDPEKRFSEDALRILRGLRFSSTYGFEIEKETVKAAIKLKDNIDFLSRERVFSELKKLILGDHMEKVMLSYPEMILKIVPELAPAVGFDQKNPHHIHDVYTHTVKCVASCPKQTDVRLAALLHDAGKPETFSEINGVGHFYGHSEAGLKLAEKALSRLRSDTKTKETVLTLIKYHDPVIPVNEKNVRRMMNKLTPEVLLKLLDLKKADNLAQSPDCFDRLKDYDEIRRMIYKITEENSCFSLGQLKIGGDDLIEMGIPEGKMIGKILGDLLSLVISGELENEFNVLKEKAREISENKRS